MGKSNGKKQQQKKENEKNVPSLRVGMERMWSLPGVHIQQGLVHNMIAG